MLLQVPLQTVTPSLDGEVLYALARARETFTVTWLEALLPSRSPSGIRRVLERLVTQGVVDEMRIGRAVGYRLNTEHLAAGPIIALARLRETFVERLRSEIETWAEQPECVALFGSGATGEMTEASDIDLFFLRPAHASPEFDDHVHALAATARRWTGNAVNPLVLDVDHVHAHGSDEPVLADIAEHGIAVMGDIWALRRAVR